VSFPRDTILPFALSADSTSLVYKVCDVQVYIQSGKLSYVVSIPLIDKGQFKAYYLVPILIQVDKDKLVYIRTEKSILCVDTIRQYYFLVQTRNYRVARKLLNEGTRASNINHCCLA